MGRLSFVAMNASAAQTQKLALVLTTITGGCDRFYRIAGSDKHGTVVGSGLGLAIVKSIVDFHGATLTLGRSERLNGLKLSVGFSQAT